MPVARDSGSVVEGLKKLYTEIAQLKLLPDAPEHSAFLNMLDTGVMKYLQAQAGAAAQLGSGGPMGGMGGGNMPSGGPDAVPAAQFAPGGGAGGGAVGLTPNVNPDELRRVLAQAQGVG